VVVCLSGLPGLVGTAAEQSGVRNLGTGGGHTVDGIAWLTSSSY
jgi:hypothetical protein